MAIFSYFDPIFQTCTDAITPLVAGDHYYQSGLEYVLNKNDNPTLPVVYWDLPHRTSTKTNKSGFNETRFYGDFFFIKQNNLADSETVKKAIVDQMHDAFKQWIAALETSSINPTDIRYTVIDVYDSKEFDANMTGVYVQLEFSFMNTIC